MKILFMCVANSARSQMAEALARRLLPGLEIASAGSEPCGFVRPAALRVLEEMGIPTADLHSKSVDDLPPDFVEGLDYLVTLCKEEVCPTLPGRIVRLHWPIEDPAGFEQIESETDNLIRYRNARDRIASELRLFGARLEQEGALHTVPAW
jgi:arsenate reductase